MLAQKGAVITGATGGLGRALAEALAEAGCNIMLNGLGEPADIEAFRAGLADRFRVDVRFHPADLADRGQIADMMAAAEAAFGAVDILFNNAVVRYFHDIDELPPDDWDKAVAINLTSAFHTTRLALPGMKRRDFGRIVNTSSAYGILGAAGRVDYITTKTGLIGLTRATAVETADYDITCNALCPGTIDTPAITGKIRRMAEEEGNDYDTQVKLYLGQRQPGGRFISAANVAALAIFLCGPAGRDISGTTLPVDNTWVIN